LSTGLIGVDRRSSLCSTTIGCPGGAMQGHVSSYQTKRGRRWRIVYELPATLDPATNELVRRQTTRRGFERERDAQRALREAIARVEGGSHVPNDKLTVAAWFQDEWLPSIEPRDATAARGHRGTVSAATWDTYRQDLERYVIPRIGGIRLQALTPRQLDELYDELEASGGRGGRPLAAKSVANVAGIVHKALKDAVRRGRLHRNPADAVSPPTARKTRTSWWTVEQLRRFLLHVVDDELYAAWLLFATTGARTGEVAGLTWEDLDLDAGWVRVEWTLGHVGHRLTWKPRPKSRAGERTMALDPATTAALREHRQRQRENRRFAGPVWQESFTDWQGLSRAGLVWTYGDGSPIHPKTFYQRFLRHATAAELPRIRLHDVRHSYASAALASATGWHDVKVISQRLGHATVAITLDTYSHVLPAADQSVAHTLANVILGSNGQPRH
jgi:integrase